MAPTFSMELMVTPAAQDTTMCLSSMLAPISSRMKGMMCGFTARKSTSLWCTVSLLWDVRFTPIFCRNARGLRLPHGLSTHKAESPEHREAKGFWAVVPTGLGVKTHSAVLTQTWKKH